MIGHLVVRILLLALGFNTFSTGAVEVKNASVTQSGTSLASRNSAVVPISPGPNDGRIAFVTARLLEQWHYTRERLDDSVSSEFLDLYIESLDPQRMHFLQSDLAEFERYRTKLDDMTLTTKGVADTEPAYEIFNRFLERLQQRVNYAQELLKQEEFKFDVDERIAVSRKDLPNPRDLDEAKKLWLQRVRFEYLQEKLGKIAGRAQSSVMPTNGFPGSTTLTGAVARPPEISLMATNPIHISLGTGAESGAPSSSPISVTASGPLGADSEAGSTGSAQPKPPKSEHEKIVETLAHRYHRTMRLFTDWNNEDVLAAYLTALAHVYDPHSDYLNKAQLDSFSIGMNLQLFGIGAELRSEDGYCSIQRLLPGGPAEKSKKLKAGDRIVAVAQGDQPPVDIVDMSLFKAVQLIRGPKGTEVRLTIIPADEDSSVRKTLALIRDEIQLNDQAAKSRIIEFPGENGTPVRLGVIDLPSFYASMDLGGRPPELAKTDEGSVPRSTSADVAKLLKKFMEEDVRGVILDLRRNGGGSLEEAIKLTGLFIKEGPVVQVKGAGDNTFVDRDTDPSRIYDGPLIVLTSRFSASASEILAGALQDYERAIIVGDSSTHGKGTVQTIQELGKYQPFRNLAPNEAGALKVTIRKFYRASGASTQKKGVIPDIVLPSVLNHSKDIGEAALDHALEWDTTAAVPFEKLNMVRPYLPELLGRSAQRIATNQDFAYVREDIEHYLKQQEDKTVSLNEKQRLEEMDEAEARAEARKKERRARKEPEITVYEMTLKQADLPGLPEPVQKTNTVTANSTSSVETTDTNTTVTASTKAEPPLSLSEGDEDSEDEKVDVVLTEAERIMLDYLRLLAQRESVAVTEGTH